MAGSARYSCLLCLAAVWGGICCQATAVGGQPEDLASLRGTLEIVGSSGSIPLLQEAANRIGQLNPHIHFDIKPDRDDSGLEKLYRRAVQIAVTPETPAPKQIARYGLVCFPLAIDAVAVIVHPASPIASLRSGQVGDIFTGRIDKWNDITDTAGPALWIHLITREQDNSNRRLLCQKLLPGGTIAAGARVVLSDSQMKNSVAADRNAIGYVSLGQLDASTRAVALNGMVPDRRNASAEVYPLACKLTISTKGEPSAPVKAFIEFLLGEQGAEIITKHGYLPLEQAGAEQAGAEQAVIESQHR